jgi:hypothetical protein
MTDGRTKYPYTVFSVIQFFFIEIAFFRQKYQYEISSTLMTEHPPLPPVRRCRLALVYISPTSINILGAVTSLHILITSPGVTIFLLVPQDSLPSESMIRMSTINDIVS